MKLFTAPHIGIQQGSRTLFTDFRNGGPMWTGQGERSVYAEIEFPEPFATEPAVHAGIGMWDVNHNHNIRTDISVTEVTAKGFTVKFSTWGDTRIASVRMDWMAIGEATSDDYWDVS